MDDFDREAKKEKDNEIVTRELTRRSKDLIRVFNPTDKPFYFRWDSYPQVIPAQGYKDIERYLARVYVQKMTEKLIGEQQLQKGEELLALREKQLGKTFLDKYEENKEVWDRVPKLNDPELVNEHGKVLVIGLVEEYGLDAIPERDDRVEKQESAYDGTYKLMDRKILDTTMPMREVIRSDNV